MRIIKRYNNRKLYDTSQSKYVTIDDIKELVNEDIDFQIIDNSSKKDLTKRLLLVALSTCEFLEINEIKSIIRMEK